MITDIFRSFFRSIGRILAYLFIGAIISWVFFSFKNMSVNAESIKPYMINIWGNSSIPFGSSVAANGSKNGVIQVYTPIALQQYHGGQNPRYLTIEVCSGIYADFEIYNTSTDLNYIDEDITVTSVRKDCNNGYSSTNSILYTIQTTIGKWQVGLTAGSTSVALASAYFKLTSKSGYYGTFRITNVTLSYDDNIGNNYQENVIMNNTDQIAEDTGGILNTIKNVFTGITNLPGNIWNAIKGGFTSVVNAVTSVVNKITDLFDFLSDDSEPDSDISGLGNVSGLLPPGPVDSLLNIPFKFLNIVINSFAGSCVPLSFNFVFNEEFTFACFDEVFYDEVPTLLMNFINIVPAGFILILYSKHLYKKVDRATSLNSNSDDEWGVL